MSDMIPVTDEDRYLFDLQVRHGTAPRERASHVLPPRCDARTMPLQVTPSLATRERDAGTGGLPDRSIA
jgi:hypothetical protein